MIPKANLEGKLPIEMQFGRFGTKTMESCVNLEGFLVIEIDLPFFVNLEGVLPMVGEKL